MRITDATPHRALGTSMLNELNPKIRPDSPIIQSDSGPLSKEDARQVGRVVEERLPAPTRRQRTIGVPRVGVAAGRERPEDEHAGEPAHRVSPRRDHHGTALQRKRRPCEGSSEGLVKESPYTSRVLGLRCHPRHQL
jgi:hypothetical protein